MITGKMDNILKQVFQLFEGLASYAQNMALPLEEMKPDKCLGEDYIFDYHSREIADVLDSVLNRVSDDWEKVKLLFNYVRDEISYSFAPDLKGEEDWKGSVILKKKRGFCHQKAILLNTLLRGAGIPGALIFQDISDHILNNTRYEYVFPKGRLPLHGLCAAFIDGKWFRLDATLDKELCNNAGYKIVEFRKSEDLLLPEKTLSGKPHFKIISELGAFADYPHLFLETLLKNKQLWAWWKEFVDNKGLTM